MTSYDPTRISELGALLSRHGIWLTKAMGQHLLVDREVLQRMVAAAGVSSEDEVLEVGPGAGALTQELVTRAWRVVAVELDPRMVAVLREVLGEGERSEGQVLEILRADALHVEPDTVFDGRPYELVANLPYSIATPLLRRLLYHPHPPRQLTVMVQKEVGRRLAARPGDSSMGVLTVQVQLVADVECLFDVPPEAFFPRPKVESTVVRLTPRSTRDVDLGEVPLRRFFQTVEAGFGQRRKQLHNALGTLGVGTLRVSAALAAAGIAPDRRAQTLSLDEWAALTRALWGQEARGERREAGDPD